MMSAVAAPPWVAGWWARLRQRAFRAAPGDRDPVVLRHSRIYILPTGRGWTMIGTIVVMLLASLNYRLSLGIGVTFVLSGLMAASLLHTFRNLAGIEVTPLSAGESFAGGTAPFTLALHGGAIARAMIALAARGTRSSGDVPAGAALTVTLHVEARERGRLPLGRITLSSEYPLGLWRGWAYVHFPLSGVTYPAAEIGAPPLPAGAGGIDARAAGRGEDADLAGLREYQHGDAPQRVAWKAVARGAGWYTKEFEGTGGSGPLELAWSALPAELSTEARLSRLTAWVLAAERSARPFALSTPTVQLPCKQGGEHRRNALTALALFPKDGRT
jgi:uncharacterized protein (DUF58 family)